VAQDLRFGGRRREPGVGPSLTRLARPRVVLVGLRWRYEMAIMAAGVSGILKALSWIGTRGTVACLAGLLTLAGLAAMRPRVRRFAVARAWCIVTPHRVRTCFAQAWINNRAGQIPAVLRATGTPAGERVLVWCRAGTSFEDIESACDLLAAACWAADVIAWRSERFAHIVYLDVIRRPEQQAGTKAEPSPSDPDVPMLPRPGEGPGGRRLFGVPGQDHEDAA